MTEMIGGAGEGGSRQYSRGQHHRLTPPLRLASNARAHTLSCAGRPRSLEGRFTQTPSDIVMFTDAAAPDTRKREDADAPVPI